MKNQKSGHNADMRVLKFCKRQEENLKLNAKLYENIFYNRKKILKYSISNLNVIHKTTPLRKPISVPQEFKIDLVQDPIAFYVHETRMSTCKSIQYM